MVAHDMFEIAQLSTPHGIDGQDDRKCSQDDRNVCVHRACCKHGPFSSDDLCPSPVQKKN